MSKSNNIDLCRQAFPSLPWREIIKGQHYEAKLTQPLHWLQVVLIVAKGGAVAKLASDTQILACSSDQILVSDTPTVALEQLRLQMGMMLLSFQHALAQPEKPKDDPL